MLKSAARLPANFTFRDYMCERLEALGYKTWCDRMAGRRVSISLLESTLIIERWLKSNGPRLQMLNKAEWISRNSLIPVRSVEVCIAGRPEVLGGGWSLSRIGSVWHMDEEYHVYVPTDVLAQARRSDFESDGRPVHAVSQIFVFKRSGDTVKPVGSPEVMDKATRVFRGMIERMARGERRRG